MDCLVNFNSYLEVDEYMFICFVLWVLLKMTFSYVEKVPRKV